MKNLKKTGLLVVFLCVLMSNTVFANQWNWASAPGHHNQSVLLETGITSSEDTIYRHGRGEYLAEGFVQIVNMQDGTLRIDASTLAHVNVDRILHSVYLDVWSDDREDWINLDYWTFEKTKEEVENEELYMLETSFIVTGCEVGEYYRVRGLHGVEFNDELEACATETNGVQLTDWQK